MLTARLGLRALEPLSHLITPQPTCILAQTHSFKSAVSLDKIYPESSLDLAKAPKMPSTEDPDRFTGFIPIEKLQLSFMKSSGPGGQNVNKVNTKVDIRFKFAEADWIPQKIRDHVLQNEPTLLTNSGYLVVRSEKTRSQQLNIADALDKLRAVIHKTQMPPPYRPSHYQLEVQRRRAEKASRERLREKKQKSMNKGFRGAL